MRFLDDVAWRVGIALTRFSAFARLSMKGLVRLTLVLGLTIGFLAGFRAISLPWFIALTLTTLLLLCVLENAVEFYEEIKQLHERRKEVA